MQTASAPDRNCSHSAPPGSIWRRQLPRRTAPPSDRAPVPTQAEVSEIENSSRLNMRDGVLYLSMPMISMTDGPRAVSVGFVLSPRTSRHGAVRGQHGLRRIHDAADHGARRMEAAPMCCSAFWRRSSIVRRTSWKQIQAELDKISHRVFSLAASDTNRPQDGGPDAARYAGATRAHRRPDLPHPREPSLASRDCCRSSKRTPTEWLPDGTAAQIRQRCATTSNRSATSTTHLTRQAAVSAGRDVGLHQHRAERRDESDDDRFGRRDSSGADRRRLWHELQDTCPNTTGSGAILTPGR